MENNIDKLFKNKLLKHQQKPSTEAWARLEEALHGRQIKRKSLGVYWKVAATVALLLISSVFYFQTNKMYDLLKNSTYTTTTRTQTPIKITPSPLAIADSYVIKEGKVKPYQPLEKVKQIKIVNKKKEENNPNVEQNVPLPQAFTADNHKPEQSANNENLVNQEATSVQVSNIEITDNQQTVVQEEIYVTLNFTDEEAITQAKNELKKPKKTWLGKVVANFKERRKQEKVQDNEANDGKPTFSIFGIETEKLFGKSIARNE
jgi:hypothetical protein